jgi:methylase of polypeptide subunit release factors
MKKQGDKPLVWVDIGGGTGMIAVVQAIASTEVAVQGSTSKR